MTIATFYTGLKVQNSFEILTPYLQRFVCVTCRPEVAGLPIVSQTLRGPHRSQTARSKASLHMVWTRTYESYTDEEHRHGVDGKKKACSFSVSLFFFLHTAFFLILAAFCTLWETFRTVQGSSHTGAAKRHEGKKNTLKTGKTYKQPNTKSACHVWHVCSLYTNTNKPRMQQQFPLRTHTYR